MEINRQPVKYTNTNTATNKRKTDRRTHECKEIDRQTERRVDVQTDRRAKKQTDRWTDR